MWLRKNSILVVKYGGVTNGKTWSKWYEYRANRHRNLQSVQEYFFSRENCRCILIYDALKDANNTTYRGAKTGYIDKDTIQY